MKKKLVFLDVDGTLLLPSGEVSQKVKEAISLARQKGHYVFICSGRNRVGIEKLRKIGFDGFICSAGGYIEIHGEKLYEVFMSDEDVQEVIDIFSRNQVLYHLEATDMTFCDEKMNEAFVKKLNDQRSVNSELLRMMNEEKEKFHLRSMEDYYKNPEPIQKVSFMAENQEHLKEPRKLLNEKYRFVVHELFSKHMINGEIIPRQRDKATAIQKVVRLLHMSMKDTIGFGDSMNDLEMIQTCAWGVVMENGSSELKKYASHVCESVEDDGIYYEFLRLGLI